MNEEKVGIWTKNTREDSFVQDIKLQIIIFIFHFILFRKNGKKKGKNFKIKNEWLYKRILKEGCEEWSQDNVMNIIIIVLEICLYHRPGRHFCFHGKRVSCCGNGRSKKEEKG